MFLNDLQFMISFLQKSCFAMYGPKALLSVIVAEFRFCFLLVKTDFSFMYFVFFKKVISKSSGEK